MILYRDAALYAFPNDELDFARKIVVLMDDPDLRVKMVHAHRETLSNLLPKMLLEEFNNQGVCGFDDLSRLVAGTRNGMHIHQALARTRPVTN